MSSVVVHEVRIEVTDGRDVFYVYPNEIVRRASALEHLA